MQLSENTTATFLTIQFQKRFNFIPHNTNFNLQQNKHIFTNTWHAYLNKLVEIWHQHTVSKNWRNFILRLRTGENHMMQWRIIRFIDENTSISTSTQVQFQQLKHINFKINLKSNNNASISISATTLIWK